MSKKLEWTLKTIPINQLEEWAENPRKISREDLDNLKQSFIEYGHARTLTVVPEGKKFVIIGGNQSKKALLELEYTDIQCSVASRPLTETEKRKLSIHLNHRSKGEGEWNFKILDTWEDIDVEDMGLVRPESRMSKLFGNEESLEESLIEYPITIITNEMEFKEWQELKMKHKIKEDTKLFFHIAKSQFE